MPRASPSMRVVGLMSGTSADGIDVAIVDIAAAARRGDAPRLGLRGFTTIPYPPEVRAAVLRISEGATTTAAEIARLNFLIGDLFARAALDASKKLRIPPRSVKLIGSHGQTVFHQGRAEPFLGKTPVAATMQIGDPSVIAGRTGVTTIGDFRAADMAAGGQGAPLVPYFDYLFYRHAKMGRAALNIGGIANITVIPADARPDQVTAFDTGPGNMVIDALVRHFTRGKRTLDRDAALARRGILLPELLVDMLRHPYLRTPPPKTAGREQFGEAFAAEFVDWGRRNRARPEDLIRTATILTSLSILDAVHHWVLPRVKIGQLIVSGGGTRNPLLMGQLKAGLGDVEMIPSGALGVPEDAKEAVAFALLAWETWHQRPSNIPGATGAKHPAILGKVCYAPPKK